MLIAGLALMALALAMLIYGLAFARDRDVLAQLIAAELAQSRQDPYLKKLQEPWHKRVLKPAIESIASLAASITPRGLLRQYQDQLDRAGRPWGLTPQLFAALKLFSVGAGLIIAALSVAAAKRLNVPMTIAIDVPLAAAVALPDWLMARKISARRRQFARAFPDVIDLLVISVEAGMGLEAAVMEVAKRRSDVAGQEMSRVLEHLQAGMPRVQAWRLLAQRMPLPEVNSFVAALVQAEQLGTSIASVLRAQSDAVRMRRSLRIREAAAKMPVKMLFPMIFFIFPCIFIVVLGPGMIRIIHSLGSW